MQNGGLMALAGIAEGLKQGFLTYQDVKRYKDDKEFKDKQAARQDASLGLQAKEKGLIYNKDATDSSGVFGETPLYQKQQQVAEQTAGNQLQQGSPEGLAAQNKFSQGLLGQSGIKTPVPEGLNLDPKTILPEAMKVQAAKQSANIKYTNTNLKDEGKEITNAYKNTVSNKEWQKADGQLTEGNNLLKVIDKAVTNPQAANALGAYGARYVSGGQRLNQAEIQAMSGHSKDWGSRLEQAVDNARKGTLTPDNAAFMKDFIQTTLPAAQEQKEAIERGASGNYARRFNVDPEAAHERIFGKAKGLVPTGGQQSGDHAEGTTAVNKKTGERLIKKGNQWVPVNQ